MRKCDIAILGSGPAGSTAALYAARAGLKPVVMHGSQAGGQLTITTTVENYPGFEDGIQGPALMTAMQKQAERFGAVFLPEAADSVDLSQRPFVIKAYGETIEAEALIIASGASPKMIGLPAELKLMGKGVSVCATCDGFFFKGKKVFVIGGGDSAFEEAIFLTRFADSVTIVHRRDQFRASKIMIDRAKNTPKLHFIMDSVVEEILDATKDTVTAVKLRHIKTGLVEEHAVDGVFVAIGHSPNTALFKDSLERDALGYLITNGVKTKIDGVFAAGDVRDSRYRQAVVAAGDGCMAAMEAQWFLDHQPKPVAEPTVPATTEPAVETTPTAAEPAVPVSQPAAETTPAAAEPSVPVSQPAAETTPAATEPAREPVPVSTETPAKTVPATDTALPAKEPDTAPAPETTPVKEESFTVEVTGDNALDYVAKSTLPVVLDLWAEWCGPCVAMIPKIEALAKEYHGRLVIAKIDMGTTKDLFDKFNVRGIPTLLLYRDGVQVGRILGNEPMQRLKAEFDILIDNLQTEQAKAAKAELEAAIATATAKVRSQTKAAYDEIYRRIPEAHARHEAADKVVTDEAEKRLTEEKAKFEKGELDEAQWQVAVFMKKQAVLEDPAFAEAAAEFKAAQEAFFAAWTVHGDELMGMLNRYEEEYDKTVEVARAKYHQALQEKQS